MVKPDTGLFFLSSIAKTWEGYVSNILIGEHVLGLLPKGTHEYDLLITSEEVERIISNPNLAKDGVHPFEVIKKTGIFLKPPSLKGGLIEMTEYPNYTKGNYMLMA